MTLTAAIYATPGVSLPLTVALTILAAGFLVRVFVVFHDCAHGSLLPSRRANTMLSTAMEALVLSPFVRWRHHHAVHHASAGDLDRRGVGDIVALTVDEYAARPWRGRLGYRLLRNPLVMFGLGPIIAMVIGPRIVARGAKPRMRKSVLAGDAMTVVLVGRTVLADRLAGLPACLGAGGDARRLGRHLAVLRPAPVRGHLLAKAAASGATPTPRCAAARA